VAGYQRTLEAAAKVGGATTAQRLLAHESLGEVLMLTGRYDEALEQYASARALVEPERPFDEQARHLADLCRKTAEVYEGRSEYEVALEWLDKGLSYLDKDEPAIEKARIYNRGTLVHRRQGKNEEAIDWCRRSLDVASALQTLDGQRAVAHAYYNLGAIYWRRGDLAQALNYCRESVGLYQGLDDIVGLSQVYINLSNVHADQGEWDQASEALRQSLVLKQQIGDIVGQAHLANNLGYIHLDRGEWEQASELFEQSYGIWQRVGSAWGEANLLSNLAQVRIYQGDWEDAHAKLNRSQVIFSEIGSEEFLPELERRWAELFLGTGDLEKALAHIERSVELAAAQEVPWEEGLSYRILGQVHMAQGEKELAETALRRSLQILTDLNSEYEAAKTVLPLVSLGLEYDGTTVDRAQLEQAIQTFERLGAQADLAQARALEGRM
jgi:tetratricopeptide (TPR) repeat protein